MREPWHDIRMSETIRDFLVFVAYTVAVAACAIFVYSYATATPLPHGAIDTNDEQLMHDLGIPTKADIEMYQQYGRWGYSTENVMHTEHVYTALPGKEETWYELYGIEVE